MLAFLSVGVAVAVGMAASSTHLANPFATALYRSYAIAAPMLAAILWRHRRPSSKIAPLLFGLGASASLMAWQSSDVAALFTLGVAAQAPTILLILLLSLTFPGGRLEGVVDKALIGALALAIGISFVPLLLTSPSIQAGNPLFDCAGGCPPNAAQIATLPSEVSAALTAAGRIGVALVACGVLLRFIPRLRGNQLVRRRAVWALSAAALPLFVTLGLFVAASVAPAPNSNASQLAALVVMLPMAVIPIAFAIPLIHADLTAGYTLKSLLSSLARNPTRAEWRDRLAEAVDDPDLQVAWWDETTNRYTGADGRLLAGSDVPHGRARIEIDRDGAPFVALVTEPALDQEPELLEVIGVATTAAAVNADVRAARRDLARRAADATQYERIRMARDVQAGAQQRLAAIRVHVRIANERRLTDTGANGWIEEVGTGIDRVMSELRDTIWAAEPAMIARRGLGQALRAARRGAPVHVRVFDLGLRRHRTESELAVYYTCLEALQNAIKHAGPGVTVTIRLTDSHAGGIDFSIVDDGIGFDPKAPSAGAGLHNIRERVVGGGGRVLIDSTPGRGTVVAGTVPDLSDPRPLDAVGGEASGRW